MEIERQEFVQVTGDKEKSQYPIFLANLGIVTCFDRVKPELKAIPKFDTKTGAAYTNYIGEAYIFSNNETQQITYFSPNKIRVKTNDGEYDKPLCVLLYTQTTPTRRKRENKI